MVNIYSCYNEKEEGKQLGLVKGASKMHESDHETWEVFSHWDGDI